MRKEYILKRDNGSRVKIVAEFGEGYYSGIGYRTSVYTCEKGKRTWKPSFDSDCYKYRGLNMEERKRFRHQSQYDYVTEEEIHNTKVMLWESLKPRQIEEKWNE